MAKYTRRYSVVNSSKAYAELRMEEYQDLELRYLPINPYSLSCGHEFAEYADFEVIESSEAELFYNTEENLFGPKGGWYTRVTYTLNDTPLGGDTLQEIEDYTIGQMSDGIGEGFEQEPFFFIGYTMPCYLYMWHRDSKTYSYMETNKS